MKSVIDNSTKNTFIICLIILNCISCMLLLSANGRPPIDDNHENLFNYNSDDYNDYHEHQFDVTYMLEFNNWTSWHPHVYKVNQTVPFENMGGDIESLILVECNNNNILDENLSHYSLILMNDNKTYEVKYLNETLGTLKLKIELYLDNSDWRNECALNINSTKISDCFLYRFIYGNNGTIIDEYIRLKILMYHTTPFSFIAYQFLNATLINWSVDTTFNCSC